MQDANFWAAMLRRRGILFWLLGPMLKKRGCSAAEEVVTLGSQNLSLGLRPRERTWGCTLEKTAGLINLRS